MRACRDSLLRSASIGIDVQRQQWFAFAFSGALAGLAGGLFVFSKGSVFPDEMSIPRSFDALIMVLLGGVKTVLGPLAGASTFTWLQDEIGRFEYWRLILGGLIIAIVVAFPSGDRGVPPRTRRVRGSGSGRWRRDPGGGRWLRRGHRPRGRRPGPGRPSSERRAGGPVPLRTPSRGPRALARVRRGAGGRRRELHPRPGAAPRPHRAERSRQDHLLQHHQRPARARPRLHPVRRTRSWSASRRTGSGGSGSAARSRSPPPTRA